MGVVGQHGRLRLLCRTDEILLKSSLGGGAKNGPASARGRETYYLTFFGDSVVGPWQGQKRITPCTHTRTLFFFFFFPTISLSYLTYIKLRDIFESVGGGLIG